MYEVAITLHEMRDHGNVLTRYFETFKEATAVASTLVDTNLARSVSIADGRTHDERGNPQRGRYATTCWTRDEDGNARSAKHFVEVVYP